MPQEKVVVGTTVRFVSRRTAAERVARSVSTVKRWEGEDPSWPRPRLVRNRVVYVEDDLRRWMDARPVEGGPTPVKARAVLAALRRAATKSKERRHA